MTALFEWLWQGLALVGIAWLVLRVSTRLDAASRHALWWVVLAAVLVLPWIPPVAVWTGTTASMPVDSPRFAGAQGSESFSLSAPPDWAVSIAVGAWIGMVMLGLFRLARGVSFAARVHRQSVEVPRDRQARLPLWSGAEHTVRAITLRHSSRVRAACAVGGRRPAIVLPSDWLDTLDEETLDQVVMHEHAHLARFDDVSRVIEAVIDSVAGWHPAVRLALANLDVERESACDDRVVLRTGRAAEYARCLADAVATLCLPPREPQIVLHVFGRVSALQVRVARLLDDGRRRRARLRPAVVGTGVVVLGVSVFGAGQLEPLVVFAEARAIAPFVRSDAVARTDATSQASLLVSSNTVPPPTVSSPRRRSATRATSSVVRTRPQAPALQRDGQQPIGTVSSTPIVGAPIGARTLNVTTAAPAEPASRSPGAVDRSPSSPWSAAAQGGAAIGNAAGRGGSSLGAGTKKAGTAIGGFFARTGRAIGRSF